MNYSEFWAGTKEPDLCVLYKFAFFSVEVYRVQSMKDRSFWEFWDSRALGFCFCGKLAPSLGIGAHIHVTEHQWVHSAMTLILLFSG
jgi:hypothetical protein